MNSIIKLTYLFVCSFILGLSRGDPGVIEAPCKSYDFIEEFDTQDPTVFLTNKLPTTNQQIDPKLMPYVGNGHLASTIFDNAVYLNGVYNGREGESHRANIPSIHNFKIEPLSDDFKDRQYVLDVKHGIFLYQEPFSIKRVLFYLFITYRCFYRATRR